MNKLLTNKTIFIKNWLLLVSMAIVGGFAFAPFDQPLAFFFSFYGLFSFLYQAEKISEFLKKALVFNFCYFLSHLYWVAWSVKVYGMPELMPVALIGLPFILSLFPTICLIPSFYKHHQLNTFAWTAGLGLWVSEMLRSFLFTGFPWNLSGYIWDLSLLQSTSIFGIFGLSLLTIMAATVTFTRQKIPGILIFSSLLGLWVYGQLKLQNILPLTKTTLRIVQPCTNQENKWKPEFFKENLDKLELLTQIEPEKPIDISIWPEAAIPACINEFPELQQYLLGIIHRGVIITGAPKRLNNPERVFSSTYVIDASNQTVEAIFDKFHLVPFGEYVPLKWLNPFPKLTDGKIDYSEGSGAKTITLKSIKESFSPIICYEGIFSAAVVDNNNRPDWILNITNDGWFGNTSGPFQHLKIVQVRAIEEGLPLVRCANNGISAVIDAHGSILHQLELNMIGYIDCFLPTKNKPTIYRTLVNFFVDKVVGKARFLL